MLVLISISIHTCLSSWFHVSPVIAAAGIPILLKHQACKNQLDYGAFKNELFAYLLVH
jgi:hypothetical protein